MEFKLKSVSILSMSILKGFNFFWAAALLLMLVWIESSKASEQMASNTSQFTAPCDEVNKQSARVRYIEQNLLDVLSGDTLGGHAPKITEEKTISAATLA